MFNITIKIINNKKNAKLSIDGPPKVFFTVWQLEPPKKWGQYYQK